MNKNLFSRYVWIVDTISRHDGITKERINELWMRSHLSEGRPIPDRSFYNYRRAIEECFHIDILCNAAGEYYISRDDKSANRSLTNWLLDNYAVNSAMSDTTEVSDRVEVEDVPSAREFLPIALEAMRENLKIRFTYAGFNRSVPEEGILFQPWFLKRYKQRWYMLGLKEKGNEIRTYALDRVREMTLTSDHFSMPRDVSTSDYFGNILGITTSKAEIREIKLKTTPTQAKYFRALPLHPTQSEEIHNDYSIFTYQLQLNYELVHEILSYGPTVTVIAPRELRIMVTTALQETLANYNP